MYYRTGPGKRVEFSNFPPFNFLHGLFEKFRRSVNIELNFRKCLHAFGAELYVYVRPVPDSSPSETLFNSSSGRKSRSERYIRERLRSLSLKIKICLQPNFKRTKFIKMSKAWPIDYRSCFFGSVFGRTRHRSKRFKRNEKAKRIFKGTMV